MEGFSLLMGHLIGDYIFQNDWMAARKSGVPATPEQAERIRNVHGDGRNAVMNQVAFANSCSAHWACLIHCLAYTWAIYLCTFWWLEIPWLLPIFLTHYVIDRYRLAYQWMMYCGQKRFATGLFAPWSIIVVDNVWHLFVLYLTGVYAKHLLF